MLNPRAGEGIASQYDPESVETQNIHTFPMNRKVVFFETFAFQIEINLKSKNNYEYYQYCS